MHPNNPSDGKRLIKFSQAILEGITQSMEADPSVIIIGLGVPDPKGVFGTTLGLGKKFGPRRVFDMPVSENAMTGVGIGAALNGHRPIMVHQRIDFFLMAIDQVINNAAKWHYMFGGRASVPLVIRLLVGRGWGQGPQHSQSLQALFGHIPGLKVVMPATPFDAKGLLVSSVKDNNTVIFIEHRWLHGTFGEVPESIYEVPIGKARVMREGGDVTIVSSSYMTIESLKAVEILAKEGINADLVDVRSVKPLDEETILSSVRKTGRMVAVDGAWGFLGFGSELVSLAAEKAFSSLKAAPEKIAFPNFPTPTSPALADHYYPGPLEIVNAARKTLSLPSLTEEQAGIKHLARKDVPDNSFSGPF